MKKLVLASVLLFAACSSQPTQQTQPDAPPLANVPRDIYLKPTDRHPAQAPTISWAPGAISVGVRSGNNVQTSTFDVTVNQEMTWTEQEYFDDVRMEEQDFVVAGTCYDFVCQNSAGGKSELWNAYFSAKANQKSQALSEAIKGIGDKSAEKLVAAGYFRSKPKSWSEFSNEINRAAESGVIGKGIATSTLGNYRNENIASLGYGAGACTEKPRSCSNFISKLVPVSFKNVHPVIKHKTTDSRNFSGTVQVNGAVLQVNEGEIIHLMINENGQMTSSSVNGQFNRYSASSETNGHEVKISLVGQERFLRDLSSNAVTRDTFLVVNHSGQFVLDVDPSIVPTSEDPNSQLVMDYSVNYCDIGFFGGCSVFGKTKTFKIDSRVITAARTSLAIEPA
ncbi:MAG: hypothetical protein H7235_04845 [Bdellovibrionaceae bacterium]|nr:hypothetical protein [Pseudobdellovibrionaceae bacterium]